MATGLKLCVVATLFFHIYVDLFSFSVSTTPPYKYFSTKTPYEWSHPAPQLVEDELYYLKGVKGKTCTAKYVSALNRHGARNPSLKGVMGISDLHRRLVAVMGPNTNRELRSWVNRFPNNNDQALTPLGETEQRGLGQRTGTKLRSLFAGKDNTDSGLKFLVTSKNRTKDSAAAFYEGLSSIIYGGEHNESGVNAEVNNQLLRFYDDCDRYVSSVKDNKTATKEYDDFLSSDRVFRIKEKMERKLNISSEVLTSDDVARVNTFCGYEVAFFGWSPWCSLLDKYDMEILEYGGDLEHYYETSYGHEINWQQSCQLVSAIFAALDNKTVDDDKSDKFPIAQFAFCHAETIDPVYSALGLYNDTHPLRADNYDQQGQRLYRTSKILPFSANILFVLYECVPETFEEDKEIKETDYYLQMLVNEVPVFIPGCLELPCPYSVVRNHYREFIDQCDVRKLCQQQAASSQRSAVGHTVKVPCQLPGLMVSLVLLVHICAGGPLQLLPAISLPVRLL